MKTLSLQLTPVTRRLSREHPLARQKDETPETRQVKMDVQKLTFLPFLVTCRSFVHDFLRSSISLYPHRLVEREKTNTKRVSMYSLTSLKHQDSTRDFPEDQDIKLILHESISL